jgi:hypothetical protein
VPVRSDKEFCRGEFLASEIYFEVYISLESREVILDGAESRFRDGAEIQA